MTTPEEVWTARLHAAVDEHPGALAFDVSSYVAAGRRHARRQRRVRVFATGSLLAVLTTIVALIAVGARQGAPLVPGASVVPDSTSQGASPNGWIAVDTDQGGGDIVLLRPGGDSHRLVVAGSESADEACPAWSPDGTRLLFGRVTPASGSTSSNPELVVVPVGQDGKPGTPAFIGLDGFEVFDGFDAHPCGIWAQDGRWVALADTNQVWVVDTQTGAVRHLPGLRPIDLEWRPGTDELAIAGDKGTTRGANTVSAPVTLYSVSNGELRQLDSLEAAHITWSPDGTTLAYTGGETSPRQLWLADSDGTNSRLLVPDTGEANHGIGPVWSPTGHHIAYQRLITASGERHEVVLVDAADGTETVIEPPQIEGRLWYPDTVTWSPDGAILLYTAWAEVGQDLLDNDGVVLVPVDAPSNVTVLTDALEPGTDNYSHLWTAVQRWGRPPG